MLADIPFTIVSNVSGWAVAMAVVIYGFRMLMTGKIVPGTTVEFLKEALKVSRETEAEQRATIREYEATGRSAVKALRSIQGETDGSP